MNTLAAITIIRKNIECPYKQAVVVRFACARDLSSHRLGDTTMRTHVEHSISVNTELAHTTLQEPFTFPCVLFLVVDHLTPVSGSRLLFIQSSKKYTLNGKT